MRIRNQLPLPFTARELVKGNIVIIETGDLDLASEAGSEACVRRMLAVPLDKSILLDFLVGRQRGDPHPSEEHAELHRLMVMFNSRFHSRRFDYLGDGLTARLLRQAVRNLPQILSDIASARDEFELRLVTQPERTSD